MTTTNDFAQRVITAIEKQRENQLTLNDTIDIIRAEASKELDDGGRDQIPSGFSLSEMNEFAKAIHYPECWDTAAYPQVEYAVYEIVMGAGCTEHPTDKPASCSGNPTDWIKWDGGDEPVPEDSLVDLRFRCGDMYIGVLNRGYYWGHRNNGGDIIAYRVV